MNNRQRVFDILMQQPGSPLTPEQIVTMSAGQSIGETVVRAMEIDTVRAALKWLIRQDPPLVEKHRRRRDFGYTLALGAVMPLDGRKRNGKA